MSVCLVSIFIILATDDFTEVKV